MTQHRNEPVVARGSLATWEIEQRARLAVAEEQAGLARLRAERETPLRAEIAAQAQELEIARKKLEIASKELEITRRVLRNLRRSRWYHLSRRLGRSEWLERDIRRVLG
jgi:hypothetical protein